METRRKPVQIDKGKPKQMKSLKVDRKKFEAIVTNLLETKPLKREKIKVAKRKPEKLIPPQK